MSRDDLESALRVVDRRLDQYSPILDFGCGCGRVLLWLQDLAEAGSSLHGVDIDERAVRWADENLPWATCSANPPLPPLDYPDGYFDLVFSHSVFTHLDEAYQDQWLAELRRVTRPGGHLVLTVHGEAVLGMYEAAAVANGGDAGWVREALGRDGIVFVKDDVYVGGPFPDFYHSTFHAPWYVFEHWGRFFTVKGFLPRRALDFQDAVVLERPSDDDTGRTVQPVQVVRSAAPPDGAPPGRPAAGAGSGRPSDRAGELLHEGPDPATRSRWGPAGVAARRLVERLVGHHHEHHRRVDVALFEALRELETRLDECTVSKGNTVVELNARLWDVVGRQGERVNRLEADLLSEVRELRRRLDGHPGESGGP
jgi:SAM-dependent methyltransferase